jgi:hypothetical protein
LVSALVELICKGNDLELFDECPRCFTQFKYKLEDTFEVKREKYEKFVTCPSCLFKIKVSEYGDSATPKESGCYPQYAETSTLTRG